MEEYSQNSTQMSQEDTQMTQDITQMSQEEPDRSHVRNVISETHASVKPKPSLSFTTDNAKDVSKALKGFYQWLGCSAHHINLVIKEAFKKNKTAAHLLKKCKKIVSSINYSNTMIYDVRKYQEDLDLPPAKLLQEVTTRWWSILLMLISIVQNKDSTTIALSDAGKLQLILTSEELRRIHKII